MATKVTKICDICSKEYEERDCNIVNTSYYPKYQYQGRLQFQFHTDDPLLGDGTIKMFDYDLCPQCTMHFIDELQLYPKL